MLLNTLSIRNSIFTMHHSGMVNLWVLLFFAAIFTSCDEDPVLDFNGQTVLFQVYYENHAWGEQKRGFLIDKDGQVWTYNKPAQWNSPERGEELTEAQIKENLGQCVKSAKKIAANVLIDNYQKIAGIKQPEYSPQVQIGADQGFTQYYAFQYDSKSRLYRPLLLAQTGDLRTHMTDRAAIDVTAWLEKIMGDVF